MPAGGGRYFKSGPVKPTPGGAAGDGTVDGVLSVCTRGTTGGDHYLSSGVGIGSLYTDQYNILADGKNLIVLEPSVGNGIIALGGDQLQLLSSAITVYYGRLALGLGVSPIYAATKQKAETGADASLLSYTPPATPGSYEMAFSADVSAATSATGFGWTATWKDSNGHAQAPTNIAIATLGVAAHSLTVTAAANGHYSGGVEFDIDNSATAIVVKTTFGGTSIAYLASAWIKQVQ